MTPAAAIPPISPSRWRIRRRAWRLLPLAVSFAGVGLLLHGIDVRQSAVLVRRADPGWLAAAFAMTLGTLALGGGGWGVMLRRAGTGARWRDVVRWSAQAALAGQLLPGGAGGDAVRLLTGGRLLGTPRAVALLILGRCCGLIAICGWGFAGALLLRGALPSAVTGLAAAVFAVAVGCSAAALWADRAIAALPRVPALAWVRRRSSTTSAALAEYRRRPASAVFYLGVHVTGWALDLAVVCAVGHALGIGAPWMVYAVALPVSMCATLLPGTANGLGVREGVLVGLLVQQGTSADAAAALSVLLDLQMVPFALMGAIPLALARRRHHATRPAPGVVGHASDRGSPIAA